MGRGQFIKSCSVPCAADGVGAGAQHQVEGVAEEELRAGARDFFRRQRLNRAGRADRHEGRRVDRPAREFDATAARAAAGVVDGEFHRRW